MINWLPLHSTTDIEQLLEESKNNTVIVFKHSTRCPISAMVKNTFEQDWDLEEHQAPSVYLLHVIEDRPASNSIAQQLGVDHQSPQLLLIKDGLCVYDTSHNNISVEGVKQHITTN